MSRIWTDEQLAEMAKSTFDKIYDAVDANDPQKTKDLTKLMYDQLANLHDGAMVWITGLLTWIYDNYGAKALEDSERFAHSKTRKLSSPPAGGNDFKSVVERMASELKGHVHQEMSLAEDDEKVVLTNTPCGSGGRLIKMGAYNPEVGGMALISEPSPLTFSTPDFPVYCLHCPLGNLNSIDNNGDLQFVNIPPGDGTSCQFIFYKDKKDIPEEYYKRLGREKPKYE